jgi:ribosomal protein S18 acetylase RimI-like enzyme
MSLVVSSLEIGKILAKSGKTSFHAQGTCMYPNVRPGDLLHIFPKKMEEVKIGEIAVFRRGPNLFGHRIIAKEKNKRGLFILTRPDRSDQGNDGPTYDEDLLGIVSSIKRRGSNLDPAKRSYSGLERMYFDVNMKLLDRLPVVMAFASYLLAKIQYSVFYRKISPTLLKATEINFVVLSPLHLWQTADLYRKLLPDELSGLKSSAGDKDSITRWILALYSKGRKGQLASLDFIFMPKDCPFSGWCISDMRAKPLYRGIGLEGLLLGKAEEIFARSGVEEISICSSRSHKSMIGLFQELGFNKAETSLKCRSCEYYDEKNDRVILKKSLMELSLNG